MGAYVRNSSWAFTGPDGRPYKWQLLARTPVVSDIRFDTPTSIDTYWRSYCSTTIR